MESAWEDLLGSIVGVLGIGTAGLMTLACGGTVEGVGQTGSGGSTTSGAGRTTPTGGGGGAPAAGGTETGSGANAGTFATGGTQTSAGGMMSATGGVTGVAAFDAGALGFFPVPTSAPPDCDFGVNPNPEYIDAPPAACSAGSGLYEFQRVCLPAPADGACEVVYDAQLDAPTRSALADAWAQEAASEHASVASFARFTLHCLALGAPEDIVRAAQQAGLDEVDHARTAFAFASAYAGRELRPGRLDLRGSLDGAVDPIDVASRVAAESCIAETVSALLVLAARDSATDPIVKAALSRIAAEEKEHVLLGWRYLRWALTSGDRALRDAVGAVFGQAERHVGLGAVTELAGAVSDMKAHGYLPVGDRRDVALRAVREVVLPAARALLGGILHLDLSTARA